MCPQSVVDTVPQSLRTAGVLRGEGAWPVDLIDRHLLPGCEDAGLEHDEVLGSRQGSGRRRKGCRSRGPKGLCERTAWSVVIAHQVLSCQSELSGTIEGQIERLIVKLRANRPERISHEQRTVSRSAILVAQYLCPRGERVKTEVLREAGVGLVKSAGGEVLHRPQGRFVVRQPEADQLHRASLRGNVPAGRGGGGE